MMLLVGVLGCTAPQNGQPEASPSPSSAPATAATAASPAASATGTPAAAPTGEPTAEPRPTASAAIAVEDLVTGLDRPWGIAITPDERVFVGEQDSGRVLELTGHEEDEPELTEIQVLDIEPEGEGGLLGLAASPTWDEDGLLYAYTSTSQDNRVVRFRPGESPEAVLTGIPHGPIHNGGRIAFGPDGLLYVGTGDAGESSRAQDESSLAGKILRVTPDGAVPPDDEPPGGNPFDSPVFSLGHRNVQGLAWDAEGRLYASEFGPDRDDELNRIEPGANYGWPVVTGAAGDDRFTDPVHVEQPPDASWSGAALSPDPAVPQWAGDLLVPSLRGQRLWHVELDDGTVAGVEELFVETYGRLRTAVYAPDGALWVTTSNTDIYGSPRDGDDRILRIAPEG